MISFSAAKFSIDENRNKTGLLVGLTGIIINCLIFALELFSGIATGSTTLMADAFHNLIDSITAVLTVITFLVVRKPADSKHPFGFGRVEYLCSLFSGLFLLGIGAFFARSSFEKILHPSTVQFSVLAFSMMMIAMLLKLTYSLLNRKYARKISSPTLTAAFLDALGDVFVLTVAALSIFFTKLTGITVDGFLGLAVSGFILFSGYSVIKRAVSSLVGKAPDPAIAEMITAAMTKAPFVIGVHDLELHDYGPEKVIASIHVEVPAHIPLVKAHEVTSRTELDMKQQGVDLVIHIDPVISQDSGKELS
ncbi:cation diffusion facilitator family transporter [Desulfosporosinus orientis DSM 765]|uniref:Cation diffusion facilitator family transporter n=1 Tax=Desulfosporosinus orientis (strain ATCC 19365 / DSM 765 / NCIMB 8382 / VKM B-1628 / Singapore I) TaxID=768706 RepID=G7WD97_DESOD|nr:cation diffusion facilitator family transporter [Desulfosporosinus orientis]AET67582.1 cation diffusion facilitator family transporter [Desulfosporosinus orientis DSM 765]